MPVLQQPTTSFDGQRVCRVFKLTCKKSSWTKVLENQDDFEQFIRDIAEAWTCAEIDKMVLRIDVNQADKSELA